MVLVILAILSTLVGFVGSIVPALPGPILCYIGLILLQISKYHPYSRTTIIVRGVIMIGISVLDYVIPARGVKKFGGTKRGDRGSNIGLIVATILLPIAGISTGPFGLLGLIGGPFLGAYIGEKIHGSQHKHALRAALGSFVGFLAGTFIKIVVSSIITIIILKDIYHIFF